MHASWQTSDEQHVLDWQNNKGLTALHLASKKGDEVIVTVSAVVLGIEAVAELPYRPCSTWEPTSIFLTSKATRRCITRRVSASLKVPSSFFRSHLSLTLATVIRLLIERGASYQAKNERGWTASDYAYSCGLSHHDDE
jgi:ankyrin repeat protein